MRTRPAFFSPSLALRAFPAPICASAARRSASSLAACFTRVAFVRPRSVAPCRRAPSTPVWQVSEENDTSATHPPGRVVVVVVVVCAAARAGTTAPRTSPIMTLRTVIVHLLDSRDPTRATGVPVPSFQALVPPRAAVEHEHFNPLQGLHAGIRTAQLPAGAPWSAPHPRTWGRLPHHVLTRGRAHSHPRTRPRAIVPPPSTASSAPVTNSLSRLAR